ncbi:MAG: CBS domain-containing protein [bacterium]|nr:CBS domain-containing protein [bacterium]
MSTATKRPGMGRVRRTIFRMVERFEPDETAVMVVVAVAVGLVGGFGAILFRWLVDAFQGLAIGPGEHTVQLLASVPWWKRLLLPVAGGLVVGPLVHFGAREARGHGVPEVLDAMVFRRGVIRPVVAAVKIMASALTIAFGGSVGREGPIVQIGAAMGSTLGQWLRFSPQRLRTLIGCGAAAGIAATFNAPIAGAFFALEILMRDFAVVTFAPIIVASVTATAISREFLGDTPAFPVPGFTLGDPLELPLYLVLGLLVGLLAVAYVRSLYACEDLAARSFVPRWLQPAVGGVFLGLLLVRFPQVYGVGYGTMVEALDGRLLGWTMLLLVAVKLLAVNITLGSGFSGGIFAPALFLGGMLGGAFGSLVGQVLPGSHDAVGAFAMVGMSAMVGAATGGPLTAILILFEMTGEYRVILPLMLAGIGAALAYRSLMGDSIFTLKFARRGQKLEIGRESAVLRDFHVQDIMEVNPVTVQESSGFNEVLELFLEENEEHYYVLDEQGRLAGRISIHDVKDLLQETNLGRVLIAGDVCGPVENLVYRQDNLEDCLLRLGERDSSDLPVLYSPEQPVFVGVIRRQAVFEVYSRQVLQREDTGIKLITGEARMRGCVELPAEYKVQLLMPPRDWWGDTLRELELRSRYGISVLAIRRRTALGGRHNVMPEPDAPLEPGDRLVIVGVTDDLDRLLAEINPRAFPDRKEKP